MKDLSIEWTSEHKMGYVNHLETLPKGVNLDEQLKKVGISKETYKSWVKEFGVTSIYSPVLENINRVNPDVVTMFKSHPSIKTKTKKYGHKVSISVQLESLEEMEELVKNLEKVPNVTNVNSIGDLV